MMVSQTQPFRRSRHLLAAAVVVTSSPCGVCAVAEEPWLPPIVVSPRHCDAIPNCSDQSSFARDQEEKLQTPARVVGSLQVPVLPMEDAADEAIFPGTASVELRFQRLRELFGELQNRLELPSAATTHSTAEPSASEVVEVESPLPANPVSDAVESFTSPEVMPDAIELSKKDEAPIAPTITLPATVVEGVVDRLELADNLFGAGELHMALDVYAAIDLDEELERNRHWIMLQTAACYRRLGDVSEAARRYRQLVTVTDPAWVADLSRWWLNIIDAQQALESTTTELDSIINQIQETVHADIGSGSGTL